MKSRLSRLVRITLLGLICLSLLLPKLLLISYLNSVLWGSFGIGQTLRAAAQDFALALIVFGGLLWLTSKRRMWRFAVGGAVTSSILFLLLIDARVRELWLRPIQWDLVRYYRQNAGDLASGSEVFFRQQAGLHMTFRRFMVVALMLHWLLWGLAAWASLGRQRSPACTCGVPRPLRWRAWHAQAVTWGAVALLFIASRFSPTQLYAAQRNILVGWLVDPIKGDRAGYNEDMASRFEQPLHSLDEAIGQRREPARNIASFKNAIVIILESVRWKGLGIDRTGPTAAPTLRRLAVEGALAKCYVSLPHSSKAQFTILTGTHPCSGIEIREAMRMRWPSVIWALREQRAASTYCFSVQNLAFENTSGMLKACGIEKCVGPAELAAHSPASGVQSSFGEDDSALLHLPGQMLAGTGTPFAAVFLTMAAHHPYNYPGKTAGDGIGLAAYWKSIAYSDEMLRQLLVALGARGLLDDTLVVIVGDHGESFGEHGTFIHNNSMYEEEIAVPLVLWSADGRLRGQAISGLARQIDIAPTIADLMGISDEGYMVHGRSLLGEHAAESSYVFSFFNGVSTAKVNGTEKTIYLPSSHQVFRFDLGSDPDEQRPARLNGEERDRAIQALRAFDAYQALRFR